MTSAMVHAGILSVLVCTCVHSTHEYLFFLLVDFHDFHLFLHDDDDDLLHYTKQTCSLSLLVVRVKPNSVRITSIALKLLKI